MTKLSTCVSKLKDWIIDSEMGGTLDKTDTFYPAYKQLIILDDKIAEEEGLIQHDKKEKQKNVCNGRCLFYNHLG